MSQQPLKFGQRAEERIIELLRLYGYTVSRKEGSRRSREDIDFKIDFWVKWEDHKRKGYKVLKEGWIPIQVSVNRNAINGHKGRKAFSLGVIPVWIRDNDVATTLNQDLNLKPERRIILHFWQQVNEIIAKYPDILCWRPRTSAISINNTQQR